MHLQSSNLLQLLQPCAWGLERTWGPKAERPQANDVQGE